MAGTRLERLEGQEKRIKVQLREAKQQEKETERKRQVRALIVLGSAIANRVKRGGLDRSIIDAVDFTIKERGQLIDLRSYIDDKPKDDELSKSVDLPPKKVSLVRKPEETVECEAPGDDSGEPIILQEIAARVHLWRKNKKKSGEMMPEHLWQAAVEACKFHPFSVVRGILGLNHGNLKKRYVAATSQGAMPEA